MAPEHPARLVSSDGRGETALNERAQGEPEHRLALDPTDAAKKPPDPTCALGD